jgi:hypothetical protein
MIVEPSIDRALDAVRTQLTDVVAPAVTDQAAAMTLQFAIMILGGLIERQRHEANWLREETAAIEAAVNCIAADPSAPPALHAILDHYRREDGENADARVRYMHASRLLSEAIDLCPPLSESRFAGQLEDVLAGRLEHEAKLLGETFKWVGR